MKVNKTYRCLLDKSISSMLSAIEIYNKPNFQYREETFAILSVNAWELLLKAYFLRCNKYKLKSLYVTTPATNKDGSKAKRKREIDKNRCGNPKTLSLPDIIVRLQRNNLIRDNIVSNIEMLIELRDNAIHFVNTTPITKLVQELGFACIKNYISIIKELELEIDLSEYNFYLMPLAYIDDRKIVDGTITSETVNYINLVKDKLSCIDKNDLQYDIAISIDVDFKKGNSFNSVGFIYDPDGIKVSLTEENIKQRFPWSQEDVIKKCKERYLDFKQNKEMHRIFSCIKLNPKLSYQRRLYPSKPKPMTFFYSTNVLAEFDKHYVKK